MVELKLIEMIIWELEVDGKRLERKKKCFLGKICRFISSRFVVAACETSQGCSQVGLCTSRLILTLHRVRIQTLDGSTHFYRNETWWT